MYEGWIKKLTIPKMAQGVALFWSVCVGLVLLIAAMGKWFYPVEVLKSFDQIVSLLEFILLGLILYFRNRWKMWTLCAGVFAAWGGYAAFWYFLELPCSCMGASLHIPTFVSLLIDVLFFASSLAIAYLLGAKKDILFTTFLGCLFMSLAGFAFAEQIYRFFVLQS